PHPGRAAARRGPAGTAARRRPRRRRDLPVARRLRPWRADADRPRQRADHRTDLRHHPPGARPRDRPGRHRGAGRTEPGRTDLTRPPDPTEETMTLIRRTRLAAAAATLTLLAGIAGAQELTIRIATVNSPTSESWKGAMAA